MESRPKKKNPRTKTRKNRPGTSWSPVAGWYTEHLSTAGTYHETVVLPNTLRMLSLKPGERVLDIAAGQGYFTRAFKAEGASVEGSDISKELVAVAKEKSPDIQYHTAAAESMVFAEDGVYDTATIILALQNIQNLNGALSEAARILKKGGRLLIVMNHPAFRIPGSTAWGYDEALRVQYRRVDRYLSEATSKIDMNPGRKGNEKKIETLSFHRPLQVYVKALANAGFNIRVLEEWISNKESQQGPRKHAEDLARKEFPLFLAILAEKR